jgi:RHS repeat-associated protein
MKDRGQVTFLATRNSYDGSGNLSTVETGQLASWQGDSIAPASWASFTPARTTSYSYDGYGRKTKEQLYAGAIAAGQIAAVTQYSYDLYGRVVCTAVRMDPSQWAGQADPCVPQTSGPNGPDRITRTSYDYLGDVLVVQRAVGTPLQQNYETYSWNSQTGGAGKPATVADANGNLTTYTYGGTALNLLTQWSFPSPTAAGQSSTTDYEAYAYDANGNSTSLRKRDGRSIAYAYDALNRVMSKTYPNGGARGVYYAYDLLGHQIAARFDSASGPDAVLTGWDGFGERASSTTAMGGTSRTLGYGYNADGARTALTWPDGHMADYYRYDTDQPYYADMSGVGPLFYTPLDSYGRVASTYRWGYGASNWSFLSQYGYDGISRVASIAHQFAGGTGNVTASFGYNPASQIVSETRDNDGYAFNGYVNVARAYAPNGLNQYVSAGPATFGYDANGNLISDGTGSWGYDIENRLVSASNGAVLTYDPLGRLWQVSGTASGTTQFLYDGDALVAEYDGAGNMLRRYVHSDGEDDPQVVYAGAQVTSPTYLFADHEGSIVALTDANGTLAAVNRYDEYGIPGAGNTGRFQYTGQAWIPELGMYYYKARIYSPTLGRFMQTDPIGYKDQINLYAYVGNDPVDGTDPTGTSSWWQSVKDYTWDNFGEPLSHVPSDLADAGKHLAKGDVQYVVGDMAPESGVVTDASVLLRAGSAAATEASISRSAATELSRASSVSARTTRAGERAIRVEGPGGRVKDISPTRVKEYAPATHPNAPAGTMQKVRFRDAQPGSKQFKRDPTPVENRMTNMPTSPSLMCQYIGIGCGRR